MADSPSGSTGFGAQIEALGFRFQGSSRRGGRMWALAFNRYLTFVVHDLGDKAVLVSWSFALGDYLDDRGWRAGISDPSALEIYPQNDVRVPADIEAVGGEITRTLTTLQLDLGDPTL